MTAARASGRSNGPRRRAWAPPDRRRAGAVRHGVRERRLLHLLRARPRRGLRTRPHAARLHLCGWPLRAHREDLRRGRLDVPRGGRLVLVRQACLQRDRLVLRGLGADARLHHHDRDQRLLRAPLCGRVLPGAPAQPGRHHRRLRRRGRARRPEHPRAARVRDAEHLPRDHRPADADRADRPRRGADIRPVGARQPGAPGDGPDVAPGGLRAVDLDGRLHGNRDGLEHGRGGARPGRGRPADGQLRTARGARDLRRDLDHLAGGAPGPPRGAPLHDPARHEVPGRPRARDRLGAPARIRPAARTSLLRRRSGGDDPDHRHERGADRDLAAVVVAGRAPPAPGGLRVGPPPLPDAVVHDHRLLVPRGLAPHPWEDHVPRQPLLVRRDAVVHHRAHRGDRAPVQGPRPPPPLPGAVEHPLPRGLAAALRRARGDRDLRRLAVGGDPETRGPARRHPVDGDRAGRLPPLPPPHRRRPARAVPDRAAQGARGIPRARVRIRPRAALRHRRERQRDVIRGAPRRRGRDRGRAVRDRRAPSALARRRHGGRGGSGARRARHRPDPRPRAQAQGAHQHDSHEEPRRGASR